MLKKGGYGMYSCLRGNTIGTGRDSKNIFLIIYQRPVNGGVSRLARMSQTNGEPESTG
jgi:hypothetical protein